MKTIVLTLVTLVLVAPARAHGQKSLSIEPVKDGLYVILRSGGNVGVRLGPEGVILIDETYPRDSTEIQELVGQVSDLPVIYVLSAKTTVAPERVREYGPRQPQFQTAVHVGGVDVRAVYVGPGHTHASAVTYFPDLKTVVGGDLLQATSALGDYGNGGSIGDWTEGIDRLLTLDFDTAIPTHGRVMARTEVQEVRSRIEALRAHMAELDRSRISAIESAHPIRTPGLTWTIQQDGPFLWSTLRLSDESAAESQP